MKSIIFSLLLLVFLMDAEIAFGQKAERFCSLFDLSKRFENRAFKTTAYMTYSTVSRVDDGGSFFYFPNCNNKDYFAVSNFSNLKDSEKWNKFFQKLPEEKDFIFEVNFIGKLQTTIIPLFGHLSWSRAEIEILQIDSIKDITLSKKMRPNFNTDSPLTAKGEELQVINSEIIFSLLGIGRSSDVTIEDYFDEDFKVRSGNIVLGYKKSYRARIDQEFSDNFRNAKSFELRINSVKENENLYVVEGTLKINKDSKSEVIKYENLFVFEKKNWLLRETKFFRN